MNKQWYKDRIYGYQLNIVKILNDQMHSVPKRTVLKNARKLLTRYTVLLKLDQVEAHSLWNWTVNSYNKVSKQTWGDRSRIPESLAGLYRAMEAEKNLVADRIEFNEKHSWVVNMSDVFYRCSTHSNCAEGHKAYQGRIYINRDLASEEEKAYADAHNIMDIREVMAEPIWLMTRRNCKHFFTPVSSELVLTNTLPPQQIINDTPLDSPYRAYYDRKKLLLAAGISKENDSYKRTVSLIKKYR